MNRATKIVELPALTVNYLYQTGLLLDNTFATLWKQIGMKTILSRAGFKKRSGTAIDQVVYTLSLWLWLQKSSIGLFARECLQGTMGKDVLYDTMNREDLNWRKAHELVALNAVRSLKTNDKKAFVVDDTITQRFGKKMPGVSNHYDHTSGRNVMGQQVITLGLSHEEGFVPLDSELFISQSNAQPLHDPFEDGRCTVARRYRVAQQQTKPEMPSSMVHRALYAGIDAYYLLADAWFGTKATLRLCLESSLVPVIRMKKNKMKYRIREYANRNETERDLDIRSLYQQCVRKTWQKIPGQRYQANVVDAELNLAENDKAPEQWCKVRLLFVRGSADATKTEVGKHDWAVFLTTDRALSAAEILETYALRWAIEVYFKEAKQHLGFLKEQSNHYAAYIASIHLSAIRFCLLVIAKQNQENASVASMRQQLCNNSADISYAGKLWGVFRAIISGALDEMSTVLGDMSDIVMDTIDAHIECLFTQVLQLDPDTLRLEAS
jgi:SRSO17 transposase